jgi:hypothetical protein
MDIRVNSTTLFGALACLLLVSSSGAQVPETELRAHVPLQSFSPGELDTYWPPGEPPPDTEFGYAVAIRDGVALIGTPYGHGSGRVAVYNQTANGWTRAATLSSPDPTDIYFGDTITYRDGLIIIGANTSTHIFKRSNGVWKHFQRLTAPAADQVVEFPMAVRYQDGMLFASAYRGETLPSVVYYFTRNASGKFVRRSTLAASAHSEQELFGTELSMTNTTLVVGSPRGERTRNRIFGVPNYPGGTAYVFRKNSQGNWIQAQKLNAPAEAAGFGTSVAIDRNMILVGAPKEQVEGGVHGETPDDHVAGGAVYGYIPVNGQYVQSFRLRPSPDELFGYQEFGMSVAMFDKHIAIGAVDPYGAVSYLPQGKVVTYTRNGSAVMPRGVAGQQMVSTSISLANNWLLVGSPWEERCYYGCIGSATIYDINRYQPQ